MKLATGRRAFVKTMGRYSALSLTGLGVLSTLPSCKSEAPVDKRAAVLNLIQGNSNNGYVPTGFFVHFGQGFHYGDAAVEKHLEYFETIDMDFIKIQYENTFPALATIEKPADWANFPYYGKDFYEKQLYVVGELVKRGKHRAPVIATYYSPFMCAGHSVTGELVTQHMKEDPESVKKGLDIITDSVLYFVKECKRLGVDGFLAPTQGGEGFRFDDPNIFLDYIKPSDLVVMNEINEGCICNVLHVCDYDGAYDDLTPYLDYPGHIVNCSPEVNGKMIPLKELQAMFDRPFMGGLEKRGPILTASAEDIEEEVKQVLEEAPEQFILGAECALLGNVDWKKVRRAVDTAHGKV